MEIITDGLFKCNTECGFLDEHRGMCTLFNEVLVHPSTLDFDGFENCEKCRNRLNLKMDSSATTK